MHPPPVRVSAQAGVGGDMALIAEKKKERKKERKRLKRLGIKCQGLATSEKRREDRVGTDGVRVGESLSEREL